MIENSDIVIIGAGAAGLAAASQLAGAGLTVVILEARDRIGGRMFTLHDAGLDAPIEMGAEFIHGKPHEIWDLLNQAGVETIEMKGTNWCSEEQGVIPCHFFEPVDEILQSMDDQLPDESFRAFLDRRWTNLERDPKVEEAKRRALAYVVGFNAANPDLVGVHWLVEGMSAEEKISGDRAFHSKNGYRDLVDILQHKIHEAGIPVHTGSVVTSVHWGVEGVQIAGMEGSDAFVLHAGFVLITVPLAVLKAPVGSAGAIEFSPSLPAKKLGALQRLEMGKIIRVTLKFRERFWDGIVAATGEGKSLSGKSLSDMSFLFTEDALFPTWWTTMPRTFPLITGWAPFRSAEQLSGKNHSFVTEQALQSLARVLHLRANEIEKEFEESYLHDWQSDPFSRGAYSYGKVGSAGAQQELAEPIGGRLFFAGEATDMEGHNGTVHGALASGYRAAGELLSAALRTAVHDFPR